MWDRVQSVFGGVPRVRLASPGLKTWLRGLASTLQPQRQRVAVEDFEGAFAAFLGVEHAVAVPSGKVGLRFALAALGLRPGSRVALSSFNARVLLYLLRALELEPVFIPPDKATLNIDLDALERRAAAGDLDLMVVTHLEGLPVELARVVELSQRHGIPFIEDCAHALGARVGGAPVGSFGRSAVFSFGTGKHINTLRGGMVVTNDDDLAATIRSHSRDLAAGRPGELLAPFGVFVAANVATSPGLYPLALLPVLRLCDQVGADPVRWLLDDRSFDLSEANVRRVPTMTSAQALVGQELLARQGELVAKRRRLAEELGETLRRLGLEPPRVPRDAAASYLVLPVVVPDVARFRRHLLRRGVDVQLTWMHCIEHAVPDHGCPGCFLAAHTAYLPVYPELTEGERMRLRDALGAEAT